MKFIHTADIHLDSPLCGLARYEGAPVEQMQSATRRAFVNLVDFACNERVDFVLIAGDLYDVDWKDYNTGLFFHQQMCRLRELNIAVFIVLGNHDAGNVITRQLRLPDNVKEFSTRQAETVCLDRLGVAIHGQSFAEKAVTEDLSVKYPAPVSGYFNIGLLHTALNGREGHALYAPCSLSSLVGKGYDYWALGHVHGREVVHEQPFVVFPGNLQGRHIRETGAKGFTLVEVDDRGEVKLTGCAVDVFRWEMCVVDARDCEQAVMVVDKVRWAVGQAVKQAEGRPLAVRCVIQGQTAAHHELHSNAERWVNEIRAAATEAGLGMVWMEKIQLQTTAGNMNGWQEDSPLGELLVTLRNLPQDRMTLSLLGAEFRNLKQALPSEARNDGEISLDPEHPETIKQVLNGVEELLMARLMAQ